MQNLKKKINDRMDILQQWMEQDYHMKRPEVVYEHTLTISKFWPVLSEEDKDYIQFIRNNLDKATKNKQPIWGTTELHTSIQTAARNFCRQKYNEPDRKFHPVDVCFVH